MQKVQLTPLAVVSLGKCEIKPSTLTDKLYWVDENSSAVAITHDTILTGGDEIELEDMVKLDENLLGCQVSLVKVFSLGSATAYRIVR